MKSQLCALFVVVLVAVVPSFPASADISPNPKCDNHPIGAALRSGDLDSALAMTQLCLNQSRADAEKFEKQFAGQSTLVDVAGMAQAKAGAYLCAKVEILVMKGSLKEATAALTDAVNFNKQYPRSRMEWGELGSPLKVAQAFVLEKQQDPKAAVAAYQAILADNENGGWKTSSSIARGRLAVLANLAGDNVAAEKWSREALLSDPSANVVMGILLEKSGDRKGAHERYEAALQLMNAGVDIHTSSPIFFAELKHMKDAVLDLDPAQLKMPINARQNQDSPQQHDQNAQRLKEVAPSHSTQGGSSSESTTGM